MVWYSCRPPVNPFPSLKPVKTRLALLLLPHLTFVSLSLAQAPPTAAPTPPAAVIPGEPVELSQLRQQYALRALASSKTLAEQYAVALGNLSREVGGEGDYEQALTAQRLRQELADLYAKSLDDPTLSNVVVLKAADARPSGTVSYDRTAGDLTNWKTVGSIAVWDVQKMVPGKYNVVVTYSVAPMGDPPTRMSIYSVSEDQITGGEFEFYEDSSLAGAAMNRRAGQVADTGGWDKPAYLQLAPITLNRTSARFAVKITRTRGSGGVMRLKEVRLTPAKEGDTPPPAAPPDGSTPPAPAVDEVTKINESRVARIQQSIKPYVDAYIDKVNKLAEQAHARNDEEAVADLQVETRAAQRLLERPDRISAVSNAAPPTTSLRGQGFKEWEGATYISSVNNTGDEFLVSYQGESVPVRLLWVTCPPLSVHGGAQVKMCSDYFGLEPDDIYLLGKQAQVFTDAFLQGRPLKILTRGTKDPDGHLLVAVQLEGVGDFAGVLVDNGLACVNTPTARAKNPRRFEEMTLSNLKEREKQARQRPIPPGAWAVSPDQEKPAPPANTNTTAN